MPTLDTFTADGFSSMSLSAAINKLAFIPSQIGQMNLFTPRPISTTVAAFEENSGVLSLYTQKVRGTPGQATPPSTRKLRDFRVVHLPADDTILADDAQNIRAFGQETELQTAQKLVNERMAIIKQNFEATWEHLRIGAVKGIVLDGDGTTVIHNLFTEFSITQREVDFLLGTSTTNIRTKVYEVLRHIEENLGLTFIEGVQAFCGKTFFERLADHAVVKTAIERQRDGALLREDIRRSFVFAGVTFQEYTGQIGTIKFIADSECHFFPVGVPNLFINVWAPAPFAETVNTMGLPLYAKTERMDFDLGVKLHVESNPLLVCTRPAVLVKGTTSD